MQLELFLRHIMFDDVWPVWVCRVFHNYLVNGMIFRKNSYYDKCILIFSESITWNLFPFREEFREMLS
jgi:hypothetical protein